MPVRGARSSRRKRAAEPAVVQYDDAVGHLLHVGQDVRRPDDVLSVIDGEVLDEAQEFVPCLGVEACERLVEEDDFGDRARGPGRA